jgi:hypothetical protein
MLLPSWFLRLEESELSLIATGARILQHRGRGGGALLISPSFPKSSPSMAKKFSVFQGSCGGLAMLWPVLITNEQLCRITAPSVRELLIGRVRAVYK